MSGSAAEERIRVKAEAMLRRRFPTARIIHELVLKQGGCRIDLAAVTPDLIALVEIKSERDVLTRLPAQIEAAMAVGDLFAVCVAEKVLEAPPDLGPHLLRTFAVCVAEKVRAKIRRSFEPGEGLKLPWDVALMVETPDGFDDAAYGRQDFTDLRQPRLCNPADRLEMLWASELMWIGGTKLSRQPAK